MDKVRANRAVWELLREGARVTVAGDDGSDETFRVEFIDWDNPTANQWLAVSQFWMDGLPAESEGRKRPDVIGFVNGIPLLFVELKAPHINVKEAYKKNLTDYRAQIPALFWFNGLLLLSNGPDTKIGSTHATWEHFAEWKKIHDEAEPGQLSLEVALEAVAEPGRLLDLVENFTAFIEMPGGLVKAVAKNHQYLGVNNALASYQGLERGDGRLGVFWHTQGSGKSLSMLFFTQKVLRKFPGHPTFVMVTDRIELDDQLYETFTDSGVIHGPHVQADSSAHLRQLLTEDHRYVFTLIHKFQPERGDEMPVLSERDDIVVITDEAHRSQYDTLAMNMRTALPNARFLGFTGTPLIAEEERTREVFGDYVSVYNFADSIADGATVPLYYENRIPELQLTDPETFAGELEDLLEAAELDDTQEQKLKRQFSRQYHLITRQDRLDKIADDIVEHFSTRGFRGKAMYVAIDKVTTVRMHDLVNTRWTARLAQLETELGQTSDDQRRSEIQSRIEFMQSTDMAVVVSHTTGEVDEFERHGVDISPHRRRMVKEDLDTKFKDPDDPFRLVFLCAKWLTGFDVPSCSTIYLDKPMRNHSLMQTIARANRVFPEKQSGLIVDYAGIFRNLERALAIYGTPTAGGGSGGDSPVLPIDELVSALDAAVEELQGILHEVGANLNALVDSTGFDYAALLDDTAEQVLAAGDETRTNFTGKVARARRIYRALLPDQRAHQHNKVMSTLAHVANRITIKTPTADIDHVMSDVNALLDRSIAAEGYIIQTRPDEERLVDISQVDWDNLAEQFEGRTHTAAQQLQRLLAERLAQIARTNPTCQELVTRLEQLIADYNTGSLNIEELIDRLRALAGDLDAYQQRVVTSGMTEEQLAVFDLLTKPEPVLDDNELEQVKQIARNLFEHIEEALVLDWRKTQATRATVQVSIATHLDQLPDTYNRDLYRTKSNLIYNYVHAVC